MDEFYDFKRNKAEYEAAYDTAMKRVKHAHISDGNELLLEGLLMTGPKD
jgi:hypothetical protein